MTDINLTIIIGSVREGRSGPMIARWVADQARAHGGFDIDLVDLADYDVPLSQPAISPVDAGDAYPRPERMAPLTASLDRADAFVLVTPEINHSVPASLKNAIDWHFPQWTAKPVAYVGYGGAGGGRHAAQHLENVFTELNAVSIRAGLSFPYFRRVWADGAPKDPESATYAKTMFAQLAWWAEALRTARAAAPYPS